MPTRGHYSEAFGSDAFSVSEVIITCNACLTSFTKPRKLTLEQHVGTNKHGESLRLWEASASRMKELHPAADSVSRESPFSVALCEALVKADIPLNS